MQPKYSIVIADTSCFILLHKIKELGVLKKLFEHVFTTKEVAEEFGKPLPKWIKIQAAANQKFQQTLERQVDRGEASAIALGWEIKDSLLILDDLKARKLAEHLDLNFTGTLGIFVRAKQEGIISSVKTVVKKIKATNFRFSDKVYQEILSEAGE